MVYGCIFLCFKVWDDYGGDTGKRTNSVVQSQVKQSLRKLSKNRKANGFCDRTARNHSIQVNSLVRYGATNRWIRQSGASSSLRTERMSPHSLPIKRIKETAGTRYFGGHIPAAWLMKVGQTSTKVSRQREGDKYCRLAIEHSPAEMVPWLVWTWRRTTFRRTATSRTATPTTRPVPPLSAELTWPSHCMIPKRGRGNRDWFAFV